LIPDPATTAPAAQPAAQPAQPTAAQPAPAAATVGDAPAQTAAPAPEAEPPKWLSQVSPELRANKELHRFQSLNDAAKELLTKAEARERTLYIPDPAKASKEEMSAFRKTMGIPEPGEVYTLDMGTLKDIPEAKKLADITQSVAAKAGLTRRQAQAVLEGVASGLVSEVTAKKAEIERQRTDFDDAILREVSGDAKKAEAYKNLYKAALVRFQDAGLVKVLADSGKLYDPKFAKIMATMEAYMGNDQLPGGETRPTKAQPSNTGSGAFGGAYSKQWSEEGRKK